MLPPGPARRTRYHFTATYSGDTLAPVQELLNRTQSSVRKATDIIASTQDEYDLLKQLDFIEDSPAEKRFYINVGRTSRYVNSSKTNEKQKQNFGERWTMFHR
jgi:hypothetical protein